MTTDDGPLTDAANRLMSAGLIPPITQIQLAGQCDASLVVIKVTANVHQGSLDPLLLDRIASAMAGIPHRIEPVPPGYGKLGDSIPAD